MNMALTIQEEEAMNNIMDACKLMGWNISVGGEGEVNGLIVGTEEYIDKILNKTDAVEQWISVEGKFTDEQMDFIQYITGDSKAKIQNDYYEWLNKFHPAPAHELDLNLIKAFGFIEPSPPKNKQ